MNRIQPSQSEGTVTPDGPERLRTSALFSPAKALIKTEAAPKKGHGELILVIDDDEDIRELTKTVLLSIGYTVLTAQDGLEGVALFRERQEEIKLVVTDASMPGLDGMGAIRAIRELKSQLPIILASGADGDAEEVRQTDLMHVIRLRKPYSFAQLRIAVSTGLRH